MTSSNDTERPRLTRASVTILATAAFFVATSPSWSGDVSPDPQATPSVQSPMKPKPKARPTQLPPNPAPSPKMTPKPKPSPEITPTPPEIL